MTSLLIGHDVLTVSRSEQFHFPLAHPAPVSVGQLDVNPTAATFDHTIGTAAREFLQNRTPVTYGTKRNSNPQYDDDLTMLVPAEAADNEDTPVGGFSPSVPPELTEDDIPF